MRIDKRKYDERKTRSLDTSRCGVRVCQHLGWAGHRCEIGHGPLAFRPATAIVASPPNGRAGTVGIVSPAPTRPTTRVRQSPHARSCRGSRADMPCARQRRDREPRQFRRAERDVGRAAHVIAAEVRHHVVKRPAVPRSGRPVPCRHPHGCARCTAPPDRRGRSPRASPTRWTVSRGLSRRRPGSSPPRHPVRASAAEQPDGVMIMPSRVRWLTLPELATIRPRRPTSR